MLLPFSNPQVVTYHRDDYQDPCHLPLCKHMSRIPPTSLQDTHFSGTGIFTLKQRWPRVTIPQCTAAPCSPGLPPLRAYPPCPSAEQMGDECMKPRVRSSTVMWRLCAHLAKQPRVPPQGTVPWGKPPFPHFVQLSALWARRGPGSSVAI